MKRENTVEDKQRNPNGRKAKLPNRRRFLKSTLILLILAVLLIIFLNISYLRRSSANDLSSAQGVTLKGIYSPCAILLDLKSGRTIAAKGENKQIYPASMTKIMTAIVAIQNIPDLDQKIMVPGNFYPYLYKMDASMAGFEPGETVTARDLIYGAILASGAECCLTLAQQISGSERAFVDLMNQKSAELGMKNTHFKNTTGLQDKGHYTTVKDISILLKYALTNQKFKEIFTNRSYTIGATNLHPNGFTIQSTLFENMQNLKIYKGKIMGGKTGYTDEAGLCLASLADVEGREYILVTAHAKGTHETEPYHIKDAVSIYDRISASMFRQT